MSPCRRSETRSPCARSRPLRVTYTVWIKVENDDEVPIDEAWWSVDHFASREEAIEHANEIAAQEYARTGVEPQRLDGDYEGADLDA